MVILLFINLSQNFQNDVFFQDAGSTTFHCPNIGMQGRDQSSESVLAPFDVSSCLLVCQILQWRFIYFLKEILQVCRYHGRTPLRVQRRDRSALFIISYKSWCKSMANVCLCSLWAKSSMQQFWRKHVDANQNIISQSHLLSNMSDTSPRIIFGTKEVLFKVHLGPGFVLGPSMYKNSYNFKNTRLVFTILFKKILFNHI